MIRCATGPSFVQWPSPHVAGLFASHASAATVTYSETANNGTVVTTDYSPLNISVTNLSDPYGTETTTQTAGGWVLTFSPSASFNSAASNSNGPMSQETDGKIGFTLAFDSPQNIQVSLAEGGHYFTSGDGSVSVTGGGIVTEEDDALATQIGSGSILSTFGTDNTWTGTSNLGTFDSSYSSYNFSIDNDLFAEAAGLRWPGVCEHLEGLLLDHHHDRRRRTPAPTPLPLASLGGLGLCGAVLRCGGNWRGFSTPLKHFREKSRYRRRRNPFGLRACELLFDTTSNGG